MGPLSVKIPFRVSNPKEAYFILFFWIRDAEDIFFKMTPEGNIMF